MGETLRNRRETSGSCIKLGSERLCIYVIFCIAHVLSREQPVYVMLDSTLVIMKPSCISIKGISNGDNLSQLCV